MKSFSNSTLLYPLPETNKKLYKKYKFVFYEISKTTNTTLEIRGNSFRLYGKLPKKLVYYKSYYALIEDNNIKYYIKQGGIGSEVNVNNGTVTTNENEASLFNIEVYQYGFSIKIKGTERYLLYKDSKEVFGRSIFDPHFIIQTEFPFKYNNVLNSYFIGNYSETNNQLTNQSTLVNNTFAALIEISYVNSRLFIRLEEIRKSLQQTF